MRKENYYLAYGSNLSVEQMLHRCPDAVYAGTAEIKGYRLLFKGSRTGSYLTIEPKKGRKVPALVWKVSEADEAALDLYEGFPRFYRKETMEVEIHSLADGAAVAAARAFVYIMDEARPSGQPSEAYYRVCAEGYRRFGFDEKILQRAYRESTGRKHTGPAETGLQAAGGAG